MKYPFEVYGWRGGYFYDNSSPSLIVSLAAIVFKLLFFVISIIFILVGGLFKFTVKAAVHTANSFIAGLKNSSIL